MTLNEFTPGVNTSFSTELNENFNNSIIRRSSSTEDTTEYTSPALGDTYLDIPSFTKTFTPAEGTNNIINAIKFTFDSKRVTNDVFVRFKIVNNSNSQTSYSDDILVTATSYTEYNNITNFSDYLTSAEGATYIVTAQAKRQSTLSPVAYIQNITLTSYWEFLQDAVVEDWA